MNKIFAQTLFLGKNLIDLPECHSTNTIAAELLSRQSVAEGSVVTTDHQTAGRGQRGNSWEAAAGKNLTFSIILKPSFLHVQEQFSLNIITSLAIYDLLTELLPPGLSIKWPNDIYYYQQKLGGILIENTLKNTSLEWSVLGIGLNVNQTRFKDGKASSMAIIAGKDFARAAVLERLLLKLESRYLQLKAGGVAALRKEYLSRLYWLGEVHTFRSAGEDFNGKIIGIDKVGRLAVCLPDDEIRYFWIKEIEFIR
ncbi:biotin--[acetyl-CoA-carboxylase] ligase [Nafulsella turpanensis]|uniref:biotin--[acetyl-CoA-carboxylase] ligase n=1 Tax=Nafulsella turpanensis TaxID=1265690 RepID=UPI0003496E27|nr:biotin--[acetyl-CoA-carboxylase] ligase [Nafulsella turpanensis]